MIHAGKYYMKTAIYLFICAAVILFCGCSSLKYGSLDGRVYTSGDQKVQITFPEGAAPKITAGYLENQFTCPDDFEAVYLDQAAGCFLVCSAIVPPEQKNTMDLPKLLQTTKGQESVSAATARIIQQKHRSSLILRDSEVDTRAFTVFQIYTKMTDETGKLRVGSLFFQLKNRWFWLIYEPAAGSDLPPGKAIIEIRQQLFRLKDAIRMP